MLNLLQFRGVLELQSCINGFWSIKICQFRNNDTILCHAQSTHFLNVLDFSGTVLITGFSGSSSFPLFNGLTNAVINCFNGALLVRYNLAHSDICANG